MDECITKPRPVVAVQRHRSPRNTKRRLEKRRRLDCTEGQPVRMAGLETCPTYRARNSTTIFTSTRRLKSPGPGRPTIVALSVSESNVIQSGVCWLLPSPTAALYRL